MVRVAAVNYDGEELFSFDVEDGFEIHDYHNCEIDDVEVRDGVTVVLLKQLCKGGEMCGCCNDTECRYNITEIDENSIS